MKSLQEKNAVVAKAFVMLLKANNAFIGYMRAIHDKENSYTFTSFLKNFPKTQALSECKWTGFIFSAFAWCDTVECQKGDLEYWAILNNKWMNVLYRIKNNDYEISEDISRAILTRGD